MRQPAFQRNKERSRNLMSSQMGSWRTDMPWWWGGGGELGMACREEWGGTGAPEV